MEGKVSSGERERVRSLFTGIITLWVHGDGSKCKPGAPKLLLFSSLLNFYVKMMIETDSVITPSSSERMFDRLPPSEMNQKDETEESSNTVLHIREEEERWIDEGSESGG